MRIIAGQRRGHKLESPSDRTTRPTTDFVREAVFNILGASIEDATVLDLFAGTGAMGLEALSRGALEASFVEIRRENAALIKRNLETLRYQNQTKVVCADVYRFVKSLTFEDPTSNCRAIVFIDPPYREYDNHPKRVRDLLELLWKILPSQSAIVLECSQRQAEAILGEPWDWDLRRYGNTRIALAWKPEGATTHGLGTSES